MGWAEERAAQIKAAKDAADAISASAIKAEEKIAAHADDLWEMLVSHLEENTRSFAESLPLAKQSDLQALRLNQNNLTIQTRVFPLIQFEIIYRPGNCVTGLLRETYTGLGQTTTKRLNPIYFTVDHKRQPCFTDSERFLHPATVAEELMERVAQFFERAIKLPSFLA